MGRKIERQTCWDGRLKTRQSRDGELRIRPRESELK